MICYAGGKQVDEAQLGPQTEKPLVIFANRAETDKVFGLLELNAIELYDCRTQPSTRYDYSAGFDYMLLDIPSITDSDAPSARVEICHAADFLLFLHEQVPTIDELTEYYSHEDIPNPAMVLYQFFSHLSVNDAEELSDLEEAIADLEDSLVDGPPEDCTQQISRFRKRLMVLKRYYEALFELLQDLCENQSGLYTKNEVRTFRTQQNRADRLYHIVLSLRDYVTQVRESYQNELDISLNKTMKLLTAVTFIFSPLTLIVGWYGMNLMIPEFSSPIAYPIVIGLSLAVVVSCIVYFKRKNWF